MRTSFHHQSEAQSPNGPLTAATSPDTPSPGPTTRYCASPKLPVAAKHYRCSAVWGRLMVRSRSLRETKTVRKRIWPFVSDVRNPFTGARLRHGERLGWEA